MDEGKQRPTGHHSRIDTRGTTVRALPTFKGYVVDVRLREFRKADPGTVMEFIDFDSPKGDPILAEYIESLDTTTDRGKKVLQHIMKQT